ncbi:MAG: DUF3078 domain-containing protein [Marinifilaceae bacterium]|nr:DUF3078 domain-containing protein [Marinifilaceae bacterium]
MKKYILAIAMAIVGVGAANAVEVPGADTCWTKSGNIGLNLTQVSFSNWAAGGDNSFGFTASFNYSADMKKGKSLWQNRLETMYGLNKTKSDGTKKTNDRLYISSNYGYSIGKAWYVSAMAELSTQFANGYNYGTDPKTKISEFMAPGNITAGLGVKWNPKTYFTATLSAASWRGVVVRDSSLRANYGWDTSDKEKMDKKIRNEFGGDLTMVFQKDIIKNVNLYTRLQLFSNYLQSPANVDVKWDVQFVLTVNKWLSTNISTNMIYDNDTKTIGKNDDGEDVLKGAKVQFKEALSIGFTVNF